MRVTVSTFDDRVVNVEVRKEIEFQKMSLNGTKVVLIPVD